MRAQRGARQLYTQALSFYKTSQSEIPLLSLPQLISQGGFSSQIDRSHDTFSRAGQISSSCTLRLAHTSPATDRIRSSQESKEYGEQGVARSLNSGAEIQSLELKVSSNLSFSHSTASLNDRSFKHNAAWNVIDRRHFSTAVRKSRRGSLSVKGRKVEAQASQSDLDEQSPALTSETELTEKNANPENLPTVEARPASDAQARFFSPSLFFCLSQPSVRCFALTLLMYLVCSTVLSSSESACYFSYAHSCSLSISIPLLFLAWTSSLRFDQVQSVVANTCLSLSKIRWGIENL